MTSATMPPSAIEVCLSHRIEGQSHAEALIRATGADLRIGGNAFYVPSADYIQVPPPSAYFEPINFHRTVFHECGHWSGHVSQLNRDLSGQLSW